MIEKESVAFIADYRIYKDNVMKLQGQAIKIGSFDETLNTAKLIFELNGKQIQSTIDLPMNSIELLLTKIEKIL